MDVNIPQGEGQSRVEIGLDGKPFEAWEPAPGANQPAQHLYSPTDWVGGSYYPRGPAETEMLLVPRVSMEFNHFAWYSLGLGGAAAIGAAIALAFNGAGMPWFVGLGLAGFGAYYGMRSHNAGVRGFCTNGRLGMAGLVVSVAAALAIVAVIVRTFASISTIANS